MSHKLPVAVPRLASTILLLAQNPRFAAGRNPSSGDNDIQVLMMKRHGKARFMPSVYVFPGGGVDVADCVVAQDILAKHYDVHVARAVKEDNAAAAAAAPPPSFMEAKVQPSPAEGEAEAWACRAGALRELAEEASCVLHRDATVSSMAQWKAAATPSAASPQAIYDAEATSLLRPVGRWVTPRHFQYRYDTYFFAALVRGASPASSLSSSSSIASKATSLCPAQDVPLVAQASEVAELLWVSPLEALRRHENVADAFSLAPPTFLILHALARQQSYHAIAEAWAAQQPSPLTGPGAAAAAAAAAPVGRLPYSSVLPCVEPRSRMTSDKKHIQDFVLPEDYLYERSWSEPAGAYRFCGEAFDGQRHDIRMWVGEAWAKKVREDGAERWASHARDLSH